MSYANLPHRSSGFSLVEVMVALIVICVGLLGIAKLEALMLSNTGTSRLRALVALQAASLADTMHADRDYWDGTSGFWTAAGGPLALTATETNGATTFAGTNAPAAGNPSCAETALGGGVAACNSLQVADYDLNAWANGTTAVSGLIPGLSAVLQNSTTAINCSSTNNNPVSCTIAITWSENTVAANTQETAAGAPAGFTQQTYTLVVEP